MRIANNKTPFGESKGPRFMDIGSGVPITSGRFDDPDTYLRAALYVCHRATDVADAALLLDALDLPRELAKSRE